MKSHPQNCPKLKSEKGSALSCPHFHPTNKRNSPKFAISQILGCVYTGNSISLCELEKVASTPSPFSKSLSRSIGKKAEMRSPIRINLSVPDFLSIIFIRFVFATSLNHLENLSTSSPHILHNLF